MVHHKTLIQYVAPLVAMGILALGSAALAADADVEVAAASTKPAPRATAAATPHAATKPAAGEATGKADKESSLWGQVSGGSVNVRSGPGVAHDVVVTLKGGDYVQVQGEATGTWLPIAWPEHTSVWIAKEGVQLGAAAAGTERAGTIKVAAPVRGSATHKVEPLCKLDPGTKIVVQEEVNGWLKIKAPDMLHAYISAKFVTTGVRKPETAQSPAANAVATHTPAPAKEKPAAAVAAAAPKEPTAKPVATTALDDKHKDAEQKQKLADAQHDQELETTRLAAEAKLRAEQDEQRKLAAAKHQQELETARLAAEVKRKAEEEEQQRKIAESKRQQELETARRAAEARRKAEDEEQQRKIAESKRQQELETARLVAEAKRKAEDEEQQRKIAESKRQQELETARLAAEVKRKAEEEEQQRKIAESKRQQELETARLAAEAKRKAEDEEQQRKIAESRRQQELETARLAAEAKRKAEAEQQRKIADAKRKADETEQARKAADAKKKADAEENSRKLAQASIKEQVEEERKKLAPKAKPGPEIADDETPRIVTLSSSYGAFSAPPETSSNQTVAPVRPAIEPQAEKKAEPAQESKPTSSLSRLPQPAFSSSADPAQARVEPVATPISAREPVPTYVAKDTTATHGRFVLPSHTPAQPGNGAEIVEFQEPSPQPAIVGESKPTPQPAPAANPAVTQTVADIPARSQTKPVIVYSYRPATTETVTTRR